MPPKKKRSFLDWLFFQSPSKKSPPPRRKRPLPRHPSNPAEVAPPQDEIIRNESQAEPLIVYPVPCDEGVLESHIDFVEDEADSDFAGYISDEKNDIPQPGVETKAALEPAATLEEMMDSFYNPEQEEAPMLDFMLESLESAAKMPNAPAMNVGAVDDTTAPEQATTAETMATPLYDSTTVVEVPPDVSPVEAPPVHTAPIYTEILPESSNVEAVQSPTPEAEAETEASLEPTSTEWSQLFAWENADETKPEATYKFEKDSLPDYIREANEELPLWAVKKDEPPAPEPEPAVSNVQPIVLDMNFPTEEAQPIVTEIHFPAEEVQSTMADMYIPIEESQPIVAGTHFPIEDAEPVLTDIHLPIEESQPTETETPPPIEYTKPHTADPLPPGQSCAQCGAIASSSDIFCGKCGTKIINQQSINAFCGRCGIKNEHMLNFCSGCGYKLAIE